MQKSSLSGCFFCFQRTLINYLCGKGHFCNYILLCGIAIEGVILRGNIHAIIRLYKTPVILHMQTVVLHRLAMDVIILAPIMSFQHKTILRVMAKLSLAKRYEAPCPGLGIHLHFIFKGIFSCRNLLFHLLPLPTEPIGDMRKLSLPFQGPQITVFFPKPSLTASGTKQFRSLRSHLGLCQTMRTLIQHLM